MRTPTLLALALTGCFLKPGGGGLRGPEKQGLNVPPPPPGESACEVKGEIKKLDQGLQTEAPIPAALAWLGKNYSIAWARTEQVENPDLEEDDEEEDEDEAPPPVAPEMGPLQTAQIAPGAKKATGLTRLTNERSGLREIELISTGPGLAIFFEDESGLHLLQRNGKGKPAGAEFDLRGARAPSLGFSKSSGLWLAWAERCGQEGSLRLLKLTKDASSESAIVQSAEGLRCEGAGTALAASGSRLALAWLAQDPPDKKGRPGPTRIALMIGDGERASFTTPVPIKPAEGMPAGGPALAWGADSSEIAVAWLVEGGAVGFAVVKADGSLSVPPILVPGSAGAKNITPSLAFDGQYYALSWSTEKDVRLGLLDPKGEMPTAPLSLGPGERPSAARGSAAKSYSFTFWRPEEALISSKALVFGSATCFGKKKPTKKK
jgi:hypothetical protein